MSSLLGNVSLQTMALLDEDYLAALAELKEHDFYAKIISLDINENPIDEIEGLVTGGGVNLDGDSSVRRTCNILMVAKDVDVKDYYWTLKTKFKLELGLSNNLTGKYSPTLGDYPLIQWFSMGTYVIGSFSTSISGANCSISISGKDKMCMLNGDMGGQLFASIDFGTEEKVLKKFTKVNTENILNNLLSKQYYILDNDTSPTSLNDNLYEFEESKQGFWYLLNGNYTYDENNELQGTHYKKYRLVRLPDDIFNSITITNDVTYEKNKYYYKDNNEYKLNNTGSFKYNNNDYIMNDIYELTEEYTIKKIPLEKIIRESVHAYALEPYHNIIINDVDKYGLELLQWRGDEPLIMIIDENGTWRNASMANTFNVSGIDMKNFEYTTLNALVDTTYGTKFVKSDGNWIIPNPNDATTNYYRAIKINFGEDVGYRVTDLVYPGDLITSIGETLTSMLDKIKNMLGEFEYFYDTNGRFIFLRKRIYVNTAWSHFTNNGDEKYVTYSNDKRKFAFNFEGNRLFTAILNTPNLTNLRNDYSVWGKRTTASGAEVPIHARYAIDKKPVFYRNLLGEVYTVDQSYLNNEPYTLLYVVDWREIIYQMAIDYFAGLGCTQLKPLYIYDVFADSHVYVAMTSPDEFLSEVAARNPNYFPSGYTGYELYYTDMEGFWRLLYNPKYAPVVTYNLGSYEDNYTPIENTGFYTHTKDWKNGEITYICDYYITEEMAGENANDPAVSSMIVDASDSRLYWNHNIFDNPESLNFWIEFLDGGEELSQFLVSQVGIRSKVVNADKATAIFFKDIPEFIFYDPNNDNYKAYLDNELTGYTPILLPKSLGLFFTISYRNLSVKNKIDELLFLYGYCIENISLTAIPIFSLEPNTRIYVCDKETNIEGEYLINKISFSLNYNGTMNITANKAPERLY